MSVSRQVTVWCDGLDGLGELHARGCAQWDGIGYTAADARAESRFVQRPGGRDYSPECLDALTSTGLPTGVHDGVQ